MSTAKFMHMYYMELVCYPFGILWVSFFVVLFLVVFVTVAAVALSSQPKSLNSRGLSLEKIVLKFLLDFACRIGNVLQLVFGLVCRS